MDGLITKFNKQTQDGDILGDDREHYYFHTEFVIPDSVGRRRFYCQPGVAVSFDISDCGGHRPEAFDILSYNQVNPDPREHRERSRVVYVNADDGGMSGYLERSEGDRIKYRVGEKLQIGAIVEHGVRRRSGIRKWHEEYHATDLMVPEVLESFPVPVLELVPTPGPKPEVVRPPEPTRCNWCGEVVEPPEPRYRRPFLVADRAHFVRPVRQLAQRVA